MLNVFDLSDIVSKLWCHHTPINFFLNLESLGIFGVNGIRDLMSSSIAKNLMNLKDLHVEECSEIVEVIEDEGEVSIMSLFPNLR